ncbi:branched-chain amino acid ABC transporter permease [Anaerocolumna aminovalerica]|uniref:Amino acid/amide ABC transporter membrane protein 2, HAAT family n=1 Tax=Anaerocolumna aminovalerica TaxID=1527 RepID=A0A1I5GP49_9FIRM|nr:branched-chain amino acid ABC transporter permease [Anaerocolumna aminovalerica]MDU6263229.1 branched-chain amino acid ABC transporter permease [Anaerocolumna aminovalerica]SFO37733.1 amino acid/amide ABC transporter membrane protein 2, HAAT family [Anaerocolumna aminovalerica]
MEQNKKSAGQIINEKKFLILEIIIVALITAYMLRGTYPSLILCFICINTIAVTGLDILFGYTGQVSFGHAGFYAIGAYTSSILSIKLGIPVVISMIIAALVSMFFGFVIAIPASKLVKHFLSLLTIAFGNMVYIFLSVTKDLTNGFSGILNIPNLNLFGFRFKSNQSYFFLFAAVAILVLIGKKRLIHSRFGRALIAVRENPHAAAGMGINVKYYKVMAFALSALLTGLAGAFYAHLIGFISPDGFNNNQSNVFMTMLLFGGIASSFGPLIGSTILTIVTEVMQGFVRYQMLLYAIFILLVLFCMPNGVSGVIANIKSRIAKRKGKKVEPRA